MVRDAGLGDAAFAVFVVLSAWAPSDGGAVHAGQDRLMTALGRRGRSTDTVARASRDLEDAGFLKRWRRHGRALLRYQLLCRPGRDQRWDVVPRELLAALEAGLMPAGALRVWCHLDQALGARGWTRDATAELAGRVGVSSATMRRRICELVGLGLLEVATAADGERILALPGALDTDWATGADPDVDEAATLGAAGNAVVAGVEPVRELGERLESRCMDAASALTGAGSLLGDLSPEDLSPDTPSGLAPDRHLSSTGAGATHGLRPKMRDSAGGVFADLRVRSVLSASGSLFNAGPARRWRGGVASRIADALDAGMSVEVAIAAMVELGPALLEETAGRQVPAAARALQQRALEVRAGLACRHCGLGHDPLAGVHVVDGACAACVEPDVDLAQIAAAITRLSEPREHEKEIAS